MELENLKEFFKRLETLEHSNIKLCEEVRNNCAHLSRLCDDHQRQIHGFEDRPGLREDVRELKKAESSRTWHFRLIWSAVLTSISAACAALLGGGKQ